MYCEGKKKEGAILCVVCTLQKNGGGAKILHICHCELPSYHSGPLSEQTCCQDETHFASIAVLLKAARVMKCSRSLG